MTVPMGASNAVAVVTVTDSLMAHNDEIASPRNPNVTTDVRPSKDASLDVWCFSPIQNMNISYENIEEY